jgi:hypothetical protein
MLFALPCYQFPYIVMNRCFYLDFPRRRASLHDEPRELYISGCVLHGLICWSYYFWFNGYFWVPLALGRCHAMVGGPLKSPHELLWVSDPRGGSPPTNILPPPKIFLNPLENCYPSRPTSKKNIALAFLKAA